MFYYHTIIVYNILGREKTTRGSLGSPIITEVARLEADIQNANINKIKQTYGIDSKISFEVYSPVCKEIKEGSIIEFNDTYYQVDKVILWDEFAQGSIFDSYMQFAVSKYEGQLKVEDVVIDESNS